MQLYPQLCVVKSLATICFVVEVSVLVVRFVKKIEGRIYFLNCLKIMEKTVRPYHMSDIQQMSVVMQWLVDLISMVTNSYCATISERSDSGKKL
jgi:hypothetical protein